MGSTTKNGKSEMRQILGDGRKWKTGTNFRGRREYFLCCEIKSFIHNYHVRLCSFSQIISK